MTSPRWARALIRFLAPRHREDDLVGDLEELHRRRAEQRGRIAAWLRTGIETLDIAMTIVCDRLLRRGPTPREPAEAAEQDALAEASRVFVGLHQMGARPRIIDVGGGLGVDYDGSRTNFHSSKNYSMQEYANDVVAFVQEACDEANLPHPDIVTEAGRWMAAHHAVLVFDVLGVNEVRSEQRPAPVRESDPKLLQDLAEVWQTVSRKNVLECFHDAVQLKEDASTLFSLGQLEARIRRCLSEAAPPRPAPRSRPASRAAATLVRWSIC